MRGYEKKNCKTRVKETNRAHQTRAADCRYPLKMESRTRNSRLESCHVAYEADLPFSIMLCVAFVSYEGEFVKKWYPAEKQTTYGDVRQVGVQDAPVLVVSLVDLQKVGAEVVDDWLIFVGTVTVGQDTDDVMPLVRTGKITMS